MVKCLCIAYRSTYLVVPKIVATNSKDWMHGYAIVVQFPSTGAERPGPVSA